MKNKQKLISVLLCAALISSMMAGCSKEAAEASSDVKTITVVTETPGTADLALSTKFIGKVEPGESVYVFPKSAGEVIETYYEVGDTVNQGDVLFAMDDTYIQLQVDAAQAQYEATEAQINQQLGSAMDLNILQAKSAYEQASDAFKKLRDTYDDTEDEIDEAIDELSAAMDKLKPAVEAAKDALREAQENYDNAESGNKAEAKEELLEAEDAYEDLKDQYAELQADYKSLKNSEDSTLDSIETNKDTAKIGLDAAAESYEITSGKLREEAAATAAAQLNVVAASMKAAVKQLEDTRVTSPISGVIEMKTIDPHDMTGTSNYAYVVSNKTSMTVTFSVSATAVDAMEVGDEVTVTNGQKEYKGAVTEISTMVDQASGLFKVKASIQDAQDLYTGQTVTLVATTQKADNAMVIPLSAVYYEEGKPYVYINNGGVAAKTFIETGIDDNKFIEVISGITADTLVITTWDTNLMDGAVIASDKPAAQEAADAEAEASTEETAENTAAETEETVTLQTETDSQPAEN